MILPDAGQSTMNNVGGAARKQRVVFLFIIALLGTFTSWILV
jgi:hypothetical protein